METFKFDAARLNALRGSRRILFFDIEATGLEIATDRIVSLAVVRWDVEQKPDFCRSWLFNPGFPMSQEVIAIHGITDEQVADAPTFESCAPEIFDLFKSSDLAGYNLRNFDVPILWEEFNRAGIHWDPSLVNVIDVSGIFRKKEPRDLTGAVQFYLNATFSDAHSAMADTCAAASVLGAQLERYADLGAMDRVELSKFSHQDERLDLSGKIIKDAEGRAVYGFGKLKGVPVVEDPGYGEWMLRQSWVPVHTKRVLRSLLQDQSMMEL